MNRIFNGCIASILLVLVFMIVGSSPVMAGDKDCFDPKWADHPACVDPDDPPPDPGEDPTSAPAFAYYCKSNPNSGAVCLANEDGSSPVKIFSTQKFHGDQFNISAVQIEEHGRVLVEDYGVLSRIEYSVNQGGVLETIYSPQTLLTGIGDIDWDPFGDDFIFSESGPLHNIYLGNRADFTTGNPGEPIVLNPQSPYLEWDNEGLRSFTWSMDGQSLYFIKTYTINDGPWWHEVHKAEIGAFLSGGTQLQTKCLLATGEAPYADTNYCSVIDLKLNNLYEISHRDEGLMVSARGIGSDLEESYYIYIFDGEQSWVDIETPGFKGHDWTSDGTIIGQTDDDEVLTFDPETGDITILINKNATSPDWNN